MYICINRRLSIVLFFLIPVFGVWSLFVHWFVRTTYSRAPGRRFLRMAAGVELTAGRATGGGIAMEFPAGDDNSCLSSPRLPRRLRRRFHDVECRSPRTVEEIEAKLRDADLRRQVISCFRTVQFGWWGCLLFLRTNTEGYSKLCVFFRFFRFMMWSYEFSFRKFDYGMWKHRDHYNFSIWCISFQVEQKISISFEK